MKAIRSASLVIALFSLSAAIVACAPIPGRPTAAPTLAATLPPPAVSTPPLPPSPPEPTAPPPTALPGPFTLTSTAFTDGGEIPPQYTYNLPGQCSGENLSPSLTWTGAPPGAQSFAVTMIDPDGGNWVHWVQFDIPADAGGLPEAMRGPQVGVKGANDFGEIGYGGPCPPSGTHRYVFTLYALDTTLSLPQGTTLAEVEAAMQGHVLGQVQLTGLRSAG